MTVNERLVKASEPFATQHLCPDCLQRVGSGFLTIISQLPPDFAASVEKARQETVILQPAYDFRYVGYDDNTESFRNLCRRRQHLFQPTLHMVIGAS